MPRTEGAVRGFPNAPPALQCAPMPLGRKEEKVGAGVPLLKPVRAQHRAQRDKAGTDFALAEAWSGTGRNRLRIFPSRCVFAFTYMCEGCLRSVLDVCNAGPPCACEETPPGDVLSPSWGATARQTNQERTGVWPAMPRCVSNRRYAATGGPAWPSSQVSRVILVSHPLGGGELGEIGRTGLIDP